MKDEEGARWVEYAATCYLQSVKHAPQRHKNELVNVLHLLAFSEHTGAVGRALAKHVDATQRWVWLPYVPQLLLSLLNREAPHAKALLLRVAQAHPQDVLSAAHVFARAPRAGDARHARRASVGQGAESATRRRRLRRRIPASSTRRRKALVAKAKADKAQAQAAAQAAGEATVAFDGAKEVMERLRHKHAHLVTELEVLLSELGARFSSSPEERLLVVVHTLLHRCYKYPTATTAEVPASFKKELAGVCRACFSADTSLKHADFVREYKAQYERDLDPEQPTFPKALHELIDRLKRWKTQLQADVEERLPTTLRLEDESPSLRGVRFAEVEVPGSSRREARRPEGGARGARRSWTASARRCSRAAPRTSPLPDVPRRRRLRAPFLVQTSLTPAAGARSACCSCCAR